MDKNAVIEFRKVSFSYGKRCVLDSANFSLRPSTFCVLVGGNGVGKSTVIKLTLGEELPQSGEVLLFGEPSAKSFFSGRVGFVAQQTPDDYRTFPVTVFELVISGTYPLSGGFRPYNRSLKRRALEVIESVGLIGHENALLGELSGGQLQRALLGRALVCQPDLLLLDEPTSNLDERGARGLTELIAATVSETKTAVLMVTHDTARLPSVFDQVVELSDRTLHLVRQG